MEILHWAASLQYFTTNRISIVDYQWINSLLGILPLKLPHPFPSHRNWSHRGGSSRVCGDSLILKQFPMGSEGSKKRYMSAENGRQSDNDDTPSLARGQTGNQSWPFFSKTSCQSWRKPEPKLLDRSSHAVKRTVSPCHQSFYILWGDRSSVRATYGIDEGSSEQKRITEQGGGGDNPSIHTMHFLCSSNALLLFRSLHCVLRGLGLMRF